MSTINLVHNPSAAADLTNIIATGGNAGYGTVVRSTTPPAGIGAATAVYSDVTSAGDFNVTFVAGGGEGTGGLGVAGGRLVTCSAWITATSGGPEANPLRPIEWDNSGALTADDGGAGWIFATVGGWRLWTRTLTLKAATAFVSLRVELGVIGTYYIAGVTLGYGSLPAATRSVLHPGAPAIVGPNQAF